MSSMGQINSAVTTVNSLNVAMAPAIAMAGLFQNIAYSMGMAAMNQVYAQYQSTMSHQASSVVAVQKILS